MLIHEKFKEEIMKVNIKVLTHLGLEKIHDMPNEQILDRLNKLFRGALGPHPFHSECGNTLRGSDIGARIGNMKNIDDEFMRVDRFLIRWTGLADIISAKFSVEDKLFKPGDIVKCVSVDRLKTLQLFELNDFLGKHMEFVRYFGGGGSLSMQIKDVHGNTFTVPQRGFEISEETDLKKLYEEELRSNIIRELEDAKKHDLNNVSEAYRGSLREFTKYSKLLTEAKTLDVSKRADEIVKGYMDFDEKFKDFPQIRYARFLSRNRIEVMTKCLYSEPDKANRDNEDGVDDKDYPIGRFKIIINMENGLQTTIENPDISSEDKQHMHVSGRGNLCLGGRSTPIKNCFVNRDYFGLVMCYIEFLEHYNKHDPYISRDRYISKHKTTIDQLLKMEADENKKEEKKEEIEPVKKRTRVAKKKVAEKKEVSDSPEPGGVNNDEMMERLREQYKRLQFERTKYPYEEWARLNREVSNAIDEWNATHCVPATYLSDNPTDEERRKKAETFVSRHWND